MRKISTLILLLFLACCGGGGEDLAAKYQLEAKADAWEDHMPRVVRTGVPLSCTSLIVAFAVSSKQEPLPSDFVVESVSLRKGDAATWQEAPSASESRLVSPTAFTGVARDCATSAFMAGDELDVILSVRSGGASAEVRTSAKLFYAW